MLLLVCNTTLARCQIVITQWRAAMQHIRHQQWAGAVTRHFVRKEGHALPSGKQIRPFCGPVETGGAEAWGGSSMQGWKALLGHCNRRASKKRKKFLFTFLNYRLNLGFHLKLENQVLCLLELVELDILPPEWFFLVVFQFFMFIFDKCLKKYSK